MNFNNHQQLRVKIFKKLLLLLIVFLSILIIKNFFFDHQRLYYIEVIFFVLGVVSYLNFERWAVPSKIDTFTIAFTNIAFCLLLYVLMMEGLKTTAFMWLTSVPILSYMLNGIKKGFILSSVYISLACIILTVKSYLSPYSFSVDSVLDVVFLVMVVWLMSHFYEYAHSLDRKQLIHMATKDSLTNLNNRHAFYRFFDQNKTSTIGVILIDLDFFKAINDHYGHDAGDYMLVEVAKILKEYENDDIQAFRLGGEEFLLMSIDLTYEEICNMAINILVDIRTRQYVHEGCLMELTASMGVQITEGDSSNLTQLMKFADYKLYEAKQTGRNRVVCELSERFDLDIYAMHH